jgi:hypothetical protein
LAAALFASPARAGERCIKIGAENRQAFMRENPGAWLALEGGPEQAKRFLAAYNSISPPSNYQGDHILVYYRRGADAVFFVVALNGCVTVAGGYPASLAAEIFGHALDLRDGA